VVYKQIKMAHVPRKEEDMSSYREGQIHQLANKLETIGFSADEITLLAQFPYLPQIRELINGRAQIVIKKKVADPVVVKYAIEVVGSINDQVKAGYYIASHESINDHNFTADRPDQMDVILKFFDRTISTQEVLKLLGEEGLRPASMSELLAFGSRYPDAQIQYLIVALGAILRTPNGDSVGWLGNNQIGRKLGLSPIGNIWCDSYRFLAVEK